MTETAEISELEIQVREAVAILNKVAHNGCTSWKVLMPKSGTPANSAEVIATNSTQVLSPFEAIAISKSYEQVEAVEETIVLQITLSHSSLDVSNPMQELVLKQDASLPYSSYPRPDLFLAVIEVLVMGTGMMLLHPFSVCIGCKETTFRAAYTNTCTAEAADGLMEELNQKFGGLSFVKIDIL